MAVFYLLSPDTPFCVTWNSQFLSANKFLSPPLLIADFVFPLSFGLRHVPHPSAVRCFLILAGTCLLPTIAVPAHQYRRRCARPALFLVFRRPPESNFFHYVAQSFARPLEVLCLADAWLVLRSYPGVKVVSWQDFVFLCQFLMLQASNHRCGCCTDQFINAPCGLS